MSNTSVSGSFTVHSCCGYSSNDINFRILNVGLTAWKDFGVIVGNFSFEWNTGIEHEYQLEFDNGWGEVCDERGACGPDPSHPSSHNKTIEVRVTERAQASLAAILGSPAYLILGGLAVVVTGGFIASGIVILRERKKRVVKQS